MKVLHVLYQSLPQISGSSIRSRDILMSQKEIGINALAITSPFQNSIKGDSVDVINEITYIRTSQNTKNSISDQRKNILKRLFRIFAIVQFSFALFRTIKKENPDILHAHAMFFCAIPALIIGKTLKIPVVYEFRSLWMFQKSDTKNKSFINKKIEQLLFKTEMLCFKKANHAIILNESLRGFILSKTKKPFNQTVINNAVNTSLIKELKVSSTSNQRQELVFGYIGTITEYEGIEFLIETFQELYDDGFKNKLVIYGKGVNEKSIIDQINIRKDINTIEYRGPIAPSEIFQAFENIDVIINPRLNTPLTNSVTPLKPLEAMAYEKLFIGSDVGGIKEIVPKGTGFLFSSENKSALKTALQNVILLSLKEKNSYKNNALLYVQKQKSWLQNAAKYKKIYSDLLK